MEKEFVPYERAVKLKALGFDEEGLGMYSKNGSVLPLVPYTSEDKAILFSQAFRWFREKYNLFGCIDLHPSTPIHWYIRIDDVIENDYIYHSEDEGLKFGTYEMGELACLDKLIEIVESK